MINVLGITRGDYGKVKAFVDINFNGLTINGIKVVSDEGKLFVSYPRKKRANGKFYNIITPTDINVKKEIEDTVLDTYHTKK